MKTSFFSVLALGGFIATSIASPVVVDTGVQKRQDIDAIETALETLFAQIQEQTTQISKFN